MSNLVSIFVVHNYNNATRVEIIQRDGVKMINEGKE